MNALLADHLTMKLYKRSSRVYVDDMHSSPKRKTLLYQDIEAALAENEQGSLAEVVTRLRGEDHSWHSVAVQIAILSGGQLVTEHTLRSWFIEPAEAC